MDMDDQIYLGIWTNWSRDSAIMGATLTTTQSSGKVLIAFTAIFIPFVASRLWKMLCFAFHTCRSKRGAQDAIYQQRQVVLRNSSSPDSGLLSLLLLIWAWRRSYSKTIRLYPLLIFAILFIVGFTLAGGYSSLITSASGDEVLMKGDSCGRMDWYLMESTDFTPIIAEHAWGATKDSDAANYAQQCYARQGAKIFDCNRLVVSSLPTVKIDTNYGCPFKSDVCRDNATNLLLDTGYIDSNDHLGLNAPRDQRFLSRRVLSCAPLTTDGFTTSHVTENRTFIRYNYGSQFSPDGMVNFTLAVPDLQSQYTQIDRDIGSSPAGLNYRLTSQLAMSYNGTVYSLASDFIPVSAIERKDGDVGLVFLSGNGVLFAKKSDDAWYRATHIYPQGSLGNHQNKFNGSSHVYLPTEAASPLGCVQQFQWCNSEYPIPEGCGPLAGALDALAGAFPLFNLTSDDLFEGDSPPSISERAGSFLWPSKLDDTDLFGVFNFLVSFGAKALESQTTLDSGIQSSLSKDQWQIDVTKWWNTTLAFHQAVFVNTALGNSSVDANLQPLIVPPANDQERRLCRSQKIRHAGYASFNLFGLLFTYILGAVIIVMSQYQYLEWRTNGALQLHRLAQDELGYGEWSGCTDTVPTTRFGDKLIDLDITDLEYPKLHHRELTEEVKPGQNNNTPIETPVNDYGSAEMSESTVNNTDAESALSEPQNISVAEGAAASPSEDCQRLESHRVSVMSEGE